MIRHRVMTPDDLDRVLDWAAEEGWNPGHDDRDAFLAADPEGFFLAEVDGTPAAAISVVNHGALAFLGLYLCRPDHRGRGIAFGLWQAALDHAGQRTVGLDGVPDQQENYARSGFVHAGETLRFGGILPGTEGPAVRPATAADIPGLVEREARASGIPKPLFMEAWLRGTQTRRTLVLDSSAAGGFVTVRACRSGAKIGPLVAGSAGDARTLITAAASVFDGPVTIDVPASSVDLVAICQAFGFGVTFRTARMYRGAPPPPPVPFYAVGTLELG